MQVTQERLFLEVRIDFLIVKKLFADICSKFQAAIKTLFIGASKLVKYRKLHTFVFLFHNLICKV